MPTGLVFNIQRFSLHDGPGIRTTVFLKGCALNCAWCHNPESQLPQPELVRLMNRCIRCGRCNEEELSDPMVRGRDETDVEQCPTGALQSVGRECDAAELAAEAGVTFSGGEPLLQAAFVTETMRLLRADGIHTALDTCGFARWPDLLAAAANADLILYDLKLIDDARHKATTGVSNQLILQNLASLSEIHSNIRVRIPVIPGFNDDAQNLEATAAFVASFPGLRKVDLLPYHPTGEAKFARVGKEYALHGTPSPSEARLEELAEPFRLRDLAISMGGGT